MKSTNTSIKTSDSNNGNPTPWTAKSIALVRTTARDYANPVDYDHPYPSMATFANHLALGYDANRTRHSYYRQVRLIHQHFGCDPADHHRGSTARLLPVRQAQEALETQVHPPGPRRRQHVLRRSLRPCRLEPVFSQIRTKDHDTLPDVLTRQQVHDLLAHIRLRRYRTPLKLIYCCGLRLSECLGLTIHDIKGAGKQAVHPPKQGTPGPGRAFAHLHVAGTAPLLGFPSPPAPPLPQRGPRRQQLPRVAGPPHAHRHRPDALFLPSAPGHRGPQTAQSSRCLGAYAASKCRVPENAERGPQIR